MPRTSIGAYGSERVPMNSKRPDRGSRIPDVGSVGHRTSKLKRPNPQHVPSRNSTEHILVREGGSLADVTEALAISDRRTRNHTLRSIILGLPQASQMEGVHAVLKAAENLQERMALLSMFLGLDRELDHMIVKAALVEEQSVEFARRARSAGNSFMLLPTTEALERESKSGIAQQLDEPHAQNIEERGGPITEKEHSELIGKLLQQAGIPEAVQEAVAGDIRNTLARAKAEISKKPKWRDRVNFPELANLTAPKFLQRVHADLIQNKTVPKVTVRAVDADLMDAIEQYIFQRKRRGADLGDASGLVFVSKHAARNRVSRTKSLKGKFGKKTTDVVEGMREVGRAQARARRMRRRSQQEPSS